MHITKKDNYNSLSLENVQITDHFWAPKIEINRQQTIPFQYKQCKDTGRIDALKLEKDGPTPHPFWDSDIAKWIEAGSYSLANHYDPELDGLIDETIALLESAQQNDGYLNSYVTIVCPEKRWKDLRDSHELYCAGHLIEAGVAHYNATNKKSLLNIVTRFADYIDTVFGPEEGKLHGYPGHQEIELALVKLYRVTGDEKYLKLSQFFVDERGKEPHYFEEEAKHVRGYFEDIFKTFDNLKEYNQSHKPVREQEKVVGHSVRAMYMYCAMADIAKETNDESLKKACERLWSNLHSRNMYVTAGLGSEEKHEGFTFDYDLPNETSYAETCAAIGLVFWNHRMLQLDRNRKYADLMERALYNGVMSGISLDGKKFFYNNPLASLGDIHRQEWFGVSCCPPNIARLLASLGEYVYSQDESNVNVHLYIEGSSKFNIDNQQITLKQKSNYPWEGKIAFSLELENPTEFSLNLRIPEWCKNAKLIVSNQEIDIESNLDKGYVSISRFWNSNDNVELLLPMPVERIYSHPEVRQNVNQVAIQRGPVVYCVEEIDNVDFLHRLILPKKEELKAEYDDQLLGGLVKITGNAKLLDGSAWTEDLYKAESPKEEKTSLVAVPYYTWDNREPGEMRVWIQEG
jgi:DUF1680 family protein